MITGSTKTTCKLLLGAGLQSTGPMGGGKAKVVCFFKEVIIEKLFLYHTVSIVVMPPTPHPLHPSLCMSSGNREAEGRSLYY